MDTEIEYEVYKRLNEIIADLELEAEMYEGEYREGFENAIMLIKNRNKM